MFPTLKTEIDKLDAHLEKSIDKPIAVRTEIVGYILNVVASGLYGIEEDLFEVPNHDFKRMFDRLMQPPTFIEVARQNALFYMPM